MLTQFLLALLLTGNPFSAVTPRGIEVINIAQRDYTPALVDQAFDDGTPGLPGFLIMKSFTDPTFGGFFVTPESRTRVVIVSPECPTSFQWTVLADRAGVVPKIGYTVVMNSSLADDAAVFYPALTQAFSRERDLIEGAALPMAVQFCDSTTSQ